MRVLALIVLAAACRIPDEVFTIGPGHDANGSDAVDAAPPDAALPPSPLSKLFIFDGGATPSGVYVLTKDSSGNLAAAPGITQPQGGDVKPVTAVLGANGTDLYVVDTGPVSHAPELAHYTIKPDGSLGREADVVALANGASRAAMHPGGDYIALADGTASVTIVTIDPTGKLLASNNYAITSSKIANVAFVHGGSCLLATSSVPQGSPLLHSLFSMPFSTGVPGGANRATVPDLAAGLTRHPTLDVAYVAGDTLQGLVVDAYTISADCAVTALGNSLQTAISDTVGLQVDPTGAYLFAAGSRVTAFGLGAGGQLVDSGTDLAQPMEIAGGGMAVDPLVPDRIYVTGTGAVDGTLHQGAIAMQLGTNGAWSNVSAAFPGAVGGQPRAILLAP